jgi:hypothetical protein
MASRTEQARVGARERVVRSHIGLESGWERSPARAGRGFVNSERSERTRIQEGLRARQREHGGWRSLSEPIS